MAKNFQLIIITSLNLIIDQQLGIGNLTGWRDATGRGAGGVATSAGDLETGDLVLGLEAQYFNSPKKEVDHFKWYLVLDKNIAAGDGRVQVVVMDPVMCRPERSNWTERYRTVRRFLDERSGLRLGRSKLDQSR